MKNNKTLLYRWIVLLNRKGIFILHTMGWIILILSLIGGAATLSIKKEDKVFWSLAVITFVNFALGVLLVISVNLSIGLILSVILLAMMVNKYLKVRGGTGKRVN